VHPQDGTKVKTGFVYVAPPDHHLLIEKDRVAVKKGPKENRFRPSIDALFRSAAYVCGSGAVGVILSGARDDGTSGLWSIKRLGGTAIVQHPNEARFELMPNNALNYVDVDYTLPSTEIGALLGCLLNEQPPTRLAVESDINTRMAKEVQIAIENEAFQKGVMELGTLTPFTCPECHGALVKIAEGKMSRFRCHTGRAYTDNALLESVMESTGEMLWQVIWRAISDVFLSPRAAAVVTMYLPASVCGWPAAASRAASPTALPMSSATRPLKAASLCTTSTPPSCTCSDSISAI
jgi:two-component system chemotaxis response regulator CheB